MESVQNFSISYPSALNARARKPELDEVSANAECRVKPQPASIPQQPSSNPFTTGTTESFPVVNSSHEVFIISSISSNPRTLLEARKTPKPCKFAFVERNYTEDSDDVDDDEAKEGNGTKERSSDWKPPKSTLHPTVRLLMQLISNQQYFAATVSAIDYDTNKLPLGKLSKATIAPGFEALMDLSTLIADQTLAASKYGVAYGPAVDQLSNSFYPFISHAFGRNRSPVINDHQMFKREIKLLEILGEMKDAALIVNYDTNALGPRRAGSRTRKWRGR